MDFYTQNVLPMIEKTCDVLENTPQMQDILHGTMPQDRFQFQILHNYQYLIEYTRCWAVGMSKCQGFDELDAWYEVLKDTMENTLRRNREKWPGRLPITVDDMENTIMAAGKRSYTSHELARSFEGDLASVFMALFPCNINYWYLGQRLYPQCTLPEDNMFRMWIGNYVAPNYVEKCKREIGICNRLCGSKTPREQAKLLEIFATGCNYEILQWRDMYYKMETWPLPELFPPKFTTIPE